MKLGDGSSGLLDAIADGLAADREQGVVGLRIDDRDPPMALGEDRLGRQCADATIIGIDRVAWSALRPAEQPDKRRLAERAHDPGHHGTDEIPLHRRLGENAIEFNAAKRRGRFGRVRHIDEDRMGARLGERFCDRPPEALVVRHARDERFFS